MKTPSTEEMWSVGSYGKMQAVGVGRDHKLNKYLIFRKNDGTFFVLLKDVWYSEDWQKVIVPLDLKLEE